MELARKPTTQISEDLLEKLLLSLHPIALNEDSDRYQIGYHCAQRDFRYILENTLNAGPLPEVTGPVATTEIKSGVWWWNK